MRLVAMNALMVLLLALTVAVGSVAVVALVVATAAAIVAELPGLLLLGAAFVHFLLAGNLAGRITRERSRKEPADEPPLPATDRPPLPGLFPFD